MRRFFNIFWMDLLNLFKNPVLLGYNTVFAGLIILVMGFLSSGNYADIRDAYQYYTVTLLVFGMLNGAMTASNGFMERDIRKPNLRVIHSPAGPSAIWLSKMLTSAVFDYLLHAALILALCPLLGVTLGRPLYFLLLMAPVELFASALGTFFCCVLHTEEATSTLLSNLVSVLCILGGSFFPLDGLGKAAAALASLSPVKWLDDAFFALACDKSLALFWPTFAGLLALSALLMLGCRLTFRTEDYL